MSFPGPCPTCGFPMRVLPIPGDLATGRKRSYVVSCCDNPRGCPQSSTTVGEWLKQRRNTDRAS